MFLYILVNKMHTTEFFIAYKSLALTLALALVITTNRIVTYGRLMGRHGRRWRQIVHVRVVSAVVLVMVSRRVMVVRRMVVMRLVMMVMRRITVSAGAAVGRVTAAGAHGRRPVVVVMVHVHQAAGRRFRDGRTPYRSWRVAATTCV